MIVATAGRGTRVGGDFASFCRMASTFSGEAT